MTPLRLSILLLWLVLVWARSATAAEPEWTRFRGPNGCGISEAATIPATWSERDYRWRVELPGIGFSSPVVWADRVYLTSTIEDHATLIVLCLKAGDGSVLWKREVTTKPHPKYKANCDACATPAVDKDRVYVVWATPDEHVAHGARSAQRNGDLAARFGTIRVGRRLRTLAGPGRRRGRLGQRSGSWRNQFDRGARPEDRSDSLEESTGKQRRRFFQLRVFSSPSAAGLR